MSDRGGCSCKQLLYNTEMKGITLCAVLSLWPLIVSVQGTAIASDKEPIFVDELPLTAHILANSALPKAQSSTLRAHVQHVVNRLFLDDTHAAIDTPQELEQLLNAAVALKVLTERGEPTGELQQEAVQIAYMLYLAGHSYETRAATKAAVDQLPSAAADDTTRKTLEKLVATIRKLRSVAGRWLPVALTSALNTTPKRAQLYHLEGLWLRKEAKITEAIVALERSLELNSAPEYALTLYELLLEDNQQDKAASLAKVITRDAPGFNAKLKWLNQRDKDKRESRAFRTQPSTSLDDRINQLLRHHRLNQREETESLLSALLAKFPGNQRVQDLAAELLAGWGQYPRLKQLFAQAESRGPLSVRLLEARITAVADSLVKESRLGQPSPFVGYDLEADLKRYSQLRGERGAFIARATRLFIKASKAMASLIKTGKVPANDEQEILSLVNDGLKAHGHSAAMIQLVIGAHLAIGKGVEGLQRGKALLKKATGSDATNIALLIARIEAGYGVRNRDETLLKKAIVRLETLPKERLDERNKLLHQQTLWTSRLAKAALSGRSADIKPLLSDAREKLMPLLSAFDELEKAGRAQAGAVACSIGAIAFAEGQLALAHDALKRARVLSPDPRIQWLSAAVAALIIDDHEGGWDFLRRGLPSVDRPDLSFTYAKWAALAANKAGAAQAAKEPLERMITLWDAAGAPDIVEQGTVGVSFVGDFNIEITMVPGESLRPSIETNPLIVLLPDFAHDRALVAGLLTKLNDTGSVTAP